MQPRSITVPDIEKKAIINRFHKKEGKRKNEKTKLKNKGTRKMYRSPHQQVPV